MPERKNNVLDKSAIAVLFASALATGYAAERKSSAGNYAPVNGLRMYYEIHGEGKPLVLLHGGGSTIQTTFGKMLPLLAKTRQVIAIEQQGHGHTADVDRPFTFEQMADDTAEILRYLKIEKADFFGHSNGGSIALQMGIRHPDLVRKLVVASAMFKRDGLYSGLWEGLKNASLKDMPEGLKAAYLKASPHPDRLQSFQDKSVQRMLVFKDWPEKDIRSIAAPTLVMIGDSDVVKPEHAVEMFRLLPHGRLAILPSDHGSYIGESIAAESALPLAVNTIVQEFLDTEKAK